MPTRTASADRALAKLAFNAYLDTCPSRDLLASMSDKWVFLVLNSLSGGSKRYSELSRHIAGVSQKMLTQTLRNLERNGLVTRTVTPTLPVTVTYPLTELGVSLGGVVSEIKAWAEEHIPEVRQARQDYDSAL